VPEYGIPDKSIYLQESTDGKTWRDVAGPVRTDSLGRYSMSYTMPRVPGTYYYRTRFPGGSPPGEPIVEEAVSPVVMVKVLAPEEVPPIPAPVVGGLVITGVLASIASLAYVTRRRV